MRQLPSGLRFLEETDPVFMLLVRSDAQNGDRFDGDNTVQYRVAGMINGPHGTTAQHLQNLITSKSFHSSYTGGGICYSLALAENIMTVEPMRNSDICSS